MRILNSYVLASLLLLPVAGAETHPPSSTGPRPQERPAGGARPEEKSANAATEKVASELPPVSAAVTRIQKFYEGTTDLHAKFEQELFAGIGGKKKASGDVWLKKPGRMRWDYQKPEKKLMVADGTTLWVYEPDDEQAFKQNLKTSALPSSVTFLLGTGKLTDEFEVTYEKLEGVGAPGDVLLKLVPRQPTAQYRYLDFVVDPKSYMVKETFVHDQQGGVNHLSFHDVEINKGLSDAKFQFSPPAGTRVIKP